MKIWFVSIFENTPIDDNQNTRYNSLVLEATKRSHEVVFWASTFQHNIKKQRFESYKEVLINKNVKVNFVPANAYFKNISFKRMYSHFQLSKSLINCFKKEQVLPDVIVIAFPPISTSYEVIKWAKQHSIPVIVDIIDPWPDVFMKHMKGLKKQLIQVGIFPLQKKTNYVFNQAQAIIAISKQYIDWAKNYNPKKISSAYFYPAVQFDEMKSQLKIAATKIQKNKEELVVIYAGSLGHSYDINTILKAASILESQDGIKFTIAGDGPQKSSVEKYIKNHSNLIYLGRVDKEKLMEEYYRADIGLTQHINGATQSVTYKLFDLLGSGLPIMNSLESEMKNIIIDNQVGFHNIPGDANQLVENILQCYNDRTLLSKMKANALELTSTQGDAALVYGKALDFIESQVKKH